LLRAEPIAWRTIRPALAYELELGFAPEVDKHPWLNPEQMALAQQVMANEKARRHTRGIRDRTGERHGRLVVLGLARMSGRTSTWRCQCDCGTICIVSSLNLGYTRSCRCLKREAARRNALKAHQARRGATKAKGRVA
jgi:hypothetical protein